jgi:hypothetical protein
VPHVGAAFSSEVTSSFHDDLKTGNRFLAGAQISFWPSRPYLVVKPSLQAPEVKRLNVRLTTLQFVMLQNLCTEER